MKKPIEYSKISKMLKNWIKIEEKRAVRQMGNMQFWVNEKTITAKGKSNSKSK